MRIERADAGAEPTFRLFGRLEGLACRDVLRMLTGAVAEGGVVTVELDGLEACDARGTDALVALTKQARDAGGTLLLTAPRESVLRAFDAAGALKTLQLASAASAAGEHDRRRLRVLRYLTRVGEDEPFAYAANRRDFYLLSDDTLWAHESHDWLLAAHSGGALAHRTHGSYYDIDNGEPLYTERPGVDPVRRTSRMRGAAPGGMSEWKNRVRRSDRVVRSRRSSRRRLSNWSVRAAAALVTLPAILI
jgi:anti-anti-sigma regulatory factor